MIRYEIHLTLSNLAVIFIKLMGISRVYPQLPASAIIFTVRNLVRLPLNYMCYLQGFFFFFFFFFEGDMTVFAARPMLFGVSVRCPVSGKG